MLTRLKILKRLDAQMIARQEHDAAAIIRNREGKHAPKALNAALAPFLPGVNNDFGIRRRPERVARGLQFGPQLAEIVQLAIVGDPDLAVFVRHRLTAGDEVDDRQAAMAQSNGTMNMHALPIRTAMLQTRDHPF